MKMKKILVPIDFSENALNALKYAVELTNKLDAELHLTHSFHSSNKAGMFVTTQDKLRTDAKKDLVNLAKEYQEKILSGKEIQHHFIRDYPPEGIAYIARKNRVDLIVMGTKGASGLRGAIWGSVASRLLVITDIPVLAIPKYYGDFKLEHILFAIDNPQFDNNELLKPLIELKENFKTKITTFNLAEPIYVEVDRNVNVLRKSDMINEISDDYFQSLEQDLKLGLIKYSMNNDVDMICMVRKNRGYFMELMHISSTKKIIFDSPTPLLILQEK